MSRPRPVPGVAAAAPGTGTAPAGSPGRTRFLVPVRRLAGLALGTVTVPVDVAVVLLACLGHLAGRASRALRALRAVRTARPGRPASRTAADRVVHAAARLELRRVSGLLGAPPLDAAPGRRSLGYLAARTPLGLLAGAVLALVAWGVFTVGAMLSSWLGGTWFPFLDGLGGVSGRDVLVLAGPGLVLFALAVSGLAALASLERRLAVRCHTPTTVERLERRVAELTDSRAAVVAAVTDERRRIERDLHDGVQQRVVTLAMTLGRARRDADPARASALVRQAHDDAQAVLRDLQEVAWRVYPAALDGLGLPDVLADIADRSPVPVRVRYEPETRLPEAVEAAVYFVVSEAITNAVKHAAATAVTVTVTGTGTAPVPPAEVTVRVRDDGRGGADPAGSGLRGLARRVAALDGRLQVDSPPGGPTVLTAELPCG